MNEKYPRCPSPSFSIRQFRANTGPLPPTFYLGGRWQLFAGELVLWSQQDHVLLQGVDAVDWEGVVGQEGDWVIVEVASEQVGIQGDRRKIDFNNAVIRARVMSPRQREAPGKIPNIKLLRLRRRSADVIRQTFVHLGLEELQTPSLVPCPGMEPTLEPFAVDWTLGGRTQNLFLPTSPELHLKRLLALGWTDIFELKTVFRNDELTEQHQPEFEMLEWYRAFRDLNAIKNDLLKMMEALHGAGVFRDKMPPLQTVTFKDLFREYLNFDLKPETSRTELLEFCKKQDLHYDAKDSWDDLFFRLTLEHIEPHFQALGPLIVEGFPPQMAALARITPEGWADRFEFYWNGFEIANAFNELNDPEEQARRFEAEVKERQRLGTRKLKPDEGLLDYLEYGMPPCSGVALGLERLLLAGLNLTDLREVRAFSF